MTRFLALGGWLLLALVPLLQAQGPNDQFVRIYNLIQQADALAENGGNDQARQKYLEAQADLKALRKAHPDWNESVVEFRLTYVAEKLEALTRNDKQSARPPPARKSESPSPTGETAVLVRLLQEQMRQLTADKELLQARLKEALTAQPAAVDPRELAKAEEKGKALQKEVEVLKVNLEKAESKPDKPVDPAVLEEARKALAAANQKLAQQIEAVTTLTLEKEALQKRLRTFIDGAEVKALREENDSLKRQADSLKAKAEAGTKADELRQQVGVLQAELANQKVRSEKISGEKKMLEERLTGSMLRRDADLAVKTRALETELAEARTVAQTNAAMVSALQTALKAARREKAEAETQRMGIEAKLTEARATRAAGSVAPENGGKSRPDADRIKRLERERDELQKKLSAATKEFHDKKAGASLLQAQRLTNQTAVLRPRLNPSDPRTTPHSPAAPASSGALALESLKADAADNKKSSNTLPAAAGALVTEAERAFSARRYEEAETKYSQALRFDGKNVALLANLAAVQIEQNRSTEAENNLRRALASDPKDAFSLSLFGMLKIRQKKYDEALESLSQATQLDPQNADAFQYLGVVLAEKGLRAPAESAFRRAIKLAPGNANAHHNLAVVYAGQQPPSLELARWHYHKALEAGHPKDSGLERILSANKPAAELK